jgi:hypothetical protein
MPHPLVTAHVLFQQGGGYAPVSHKSAAIKPPVPPCCWVLRRVVNLKQWAWALLGGEAVGMAFVVLF